MKLNTQPRQVLVELEVEITDADGNIVVLKDRNSLDVEKNYSPSQPRDSLGRFAPIGGGTFKDKTMSDSEFISFAKSQEDITDIEKLSYRISDYQNMEAYPINRLLKETKGEAHTAEDFAPMNDSHGYSDDYVERIGGKLRDTKDALDASMRHRLAEDTYLYRGLSHFDGDLGVGDKLTTYGFSSTSFSKEVAAKHTSNAMKFRDDTSREYVLKIQAPKGTAGLVPFKITQGRLREQEFILPRNTVLTVKEASKGSTPSGALYQPDFNYTVLEVEYGEL